MTNTAQLSDETTETTLVDGVVSTDESTIIKIVDQSHPYYLHPLDYPGMNFVSTIFYGKDYGGWRRSIIITLSTKNKLGFVDGLLAAPFPDFNIHNDIKQVNRPGPMNRYSNIRILLYLFIGLSRFTCFISLMQYIAWASLGFSRLNMLISVKI